MQGTVNGTVTGVNDAPVNGLPATFNGTEDTALPRGLSISTSMPRSGPMTVTLSVDAGTPAAAAGGNVVVTGNGSAR